MSTFQKGAVVISVVDRFCYLSQYLFWLFPMILGLEFWRSVCVTSLSLLTCITLITQNMKDNLCAVSDICILDQDD